MTPLARGRRCGTQAQHQEHGPRRRDGYARRQPEATELDQTVAEQWPAFRERMEEAGGLPKFVVGEFEEFLKCGILEEGCLHLVCRSCGYSEVVALSCKKRGFCPGCLTRRKTGSSGSPTADSSSRSSALGRTVRAPSCSTRMICRWVVLVDGNKDQIAAIGKAAKEHEVQITLIIDLMHVLEYLWKAAYCFHADGTKDAEAWVEQRLIGLLQGQSAGYLAKGMRRNAKAQSHSAKDRQPVDECARYSVNHSKFIHYDRALRDGLPIATGVIEGACRYLVRDRMDRTGARWSLAGAEAVLRLRALVTNGYFADYWTFHLACEYERNHAARYAVGRVPCPLPDAQRKLKRAK